MKEELRKLLSDRVHRYGFLLAILFSLFGMLFFLLNVSRLPPVVPIFYNRPWGLPQLGVPLHLLVILLAGLCVLIVNLTLSLVFYKNFVLLSRILLWVSALVSFLATTSVVRVVLLIA